MLTLVVPRQLSPSRQRMQIYLWTGVIFVMYSVLVSLFKEKNRGMSSHYRLTVLDRSLFFRRLSVQAALVDVKTDVLYKRSALLRICFRSRVRIYVPFQSERSRGVGMQSRENLFNSSETMRQMYEHAKMLDSLPLPDAERADMSLYVLCCWAKTST